MDSKLRSGIVLIVLAALALVGCGAELRPLARPAGSAGPRAAAEHVLTAGNVGSMQELESWRVALGPVVATDYSPSEEHIATMGADRIVRVWDAGTGRMLDELHEHIRLGQALAYSPDGSQLLSGGGTMGQDIYLWDLSTGEAIVTASTDGFFVYDAAWAPAGEQFIVVSQGSSRMYIYETAQYEHINHRSSGIPLSAVAHGADYMAVANDIGNTYVFRYEALQIYEPVHLMRYDVNIDFRYEDDVPGRDLEFSAGDKLLANCYGNGVVEVWRSDDWERVSTFQAHEFVKGQVLGCRDGAFSHGGDVYFTVGDDSTLRAWDPLTGEKLAEWTFAIGAHTVSVSAGGDHVAVGTADGMLHLFSLPEARPAGE